MVSNTCRYYQKFFSITVTRQKNNFVICIENDGLNNSNTDIKKVFDRFYTEETMNEEGHLGLGLSIAQSLIRAMNGEIIVRSQDDRIKFLIYLSILPRKKAT